MAEDKNKIIEVGDNGEVISGDFLVVFKAPVNFEGKEYDSVDLSKLKVLSGRDMEAVDRQLTEAGIVSVIPENSISYAFRMAARASGLPVEFFLSLPPNECMKVKRAVAGFLNGVD